jgi:hypothetical protein
MTSPIIPVSETPITAAQFVSEVTGMDHITRDAHAVAALLAGNVPAHMRSFVDVTTTFRSADNQTHTLTLHVMPDVLCIGTNADYLRTSLSPLAAQQVCDAWDCMLPTTRMSDLIWAAAVNKLQPLPWGPPYDASMMTTERLVIHNQRINKQLEMMKLDATKLTAGHKKDVVMTQRLERQTKQVAIYGWQQLNGRPIQPLYLGHENTYADYSHGLRLVSLDCELDGTTMRLPVILADANLSLGISSEGAQTVYRQPPA